VGEATVTSEEALGMGHVPLWKATVILVIATGFVALMSEMLVGTVEHAAERLGMTDVFVGVFLLAIIGNAAEHSTAVLMAMKNKMDLSMNIAIGSSIQVALLVAPLLVFISYAFGSPMDLVFTTFEIAAVALSAAVVNLIALDGESNWMEGVLLLAVYGILGIVFYAL
jgi:Ca2+:H+ antiporter